MGRFLSWLFGGAGEICFQCKRRRPRSANNHMYCVECEAEIRRAYENRNHCPHCGTIGEHRGTSHWSGRNDRGEACGGFVDQWYCRACRQSYGIPK